MRATGAIRWSVSLAALLAVALGSFVPMMFALAKTPLHDGSDVPTPPLLAAALAGSVVAGALAAGLVHRLLRGRARRDDAAGAGPG